MMKLTWIVLCGVLDSALLSGLVPELHTSRNDHGDSETRAGSSRLETDAPPGDPLVGVWGCELNLGPTTRGQLIIDGRGREWRARIGGFDETIQRKENEIRFTLPTGEEFRGHVTAGAKALNGQWIQPLSAVHFQRYATPVELRSGTTKSVWTGQVVPLDDRISFYVAIRRAVDGALKGIVRNPDFGWFGGRTYHVELKDRNVTLTSGQVQLQGSYDSTNDNLWLGVLANYAPSLFTRRSNRDAVGFYPRMFQQPPTYAYRQPVAENDGWPTASLAQVGIDTGIVSSLIRTILDCDPQDLTATPVHSIMMARHGKLVLEEYFYGFDRDRPHDMRSAGKTFAPAMIGVARQQGAIVDADTRVETLFPEYRPFANLDERKRKLTVGDLMTMTSGLACDDNDGSSPGSEGQMQQQSAQPDWYKYTLDLPMVREPGGDKAIYCSASLNLVGGVAKEASGTWLPDLFYERFARPLQFGLYHLNLMPTGDAYMGGGSYLRPRDELKLGQLYLDRGVWHGQRIIGADWVKQSVTAHATFIRPVIETEQNHQYGYGWHIHHFTVAGRDYLEYAAEGNGGQFVMVISDLDMVVAINAGSYGNLNWYRWGLEVIPKYLIPSATTAPRR